MKKYAIYIEVDTGEYMYAPSENPFTVNTAPMIYNTREEAEIGNTWQTGVIVEIEVSK